MFAFPIYTSRRSPAAHRRLFGEEDLYEFPFSLILISSQF